MVHRVWLLLLLGTAACDAAAPRVENPIESLARAFVGPKVVPACTSTDRSAAGDRNYRECAWLRVPASRAETVTVTIYDSGSSALSWNHVVPDSTGARQFTDTLDSFASSRKLTRRDCGTSVSPAGPSRETLWQSDTFILYAIHFQPDTTPHRILVIATDSPGEFPMALACGNPDPAQQS